MRYAEQRRQERVAPRLLDDALARGKTVNLASPISRQKGFGGSQGRLQQMLGKNGAIDEAIHSRAGIVGVQGDDAVKGVGPNLCFEEFDLRLL